MAKIISAARSELNPAFTDLLINSELKTTGRSVLPGLWVHSSSLCLCSCAASWTSQSMGCLLIMVLATVGECVERALVIYKNVNKSTGNAVRVQEDGG